MNKDTRIVYREGTRIVNTPVIMRDIIRCLDDVPYDMAEDILLEVLDKLHTLPIKADIK